MKSFIFALLALAVAGCLAETGPACPPDDPLVEPEGPLNVTFEPIFVIETGVHGEATFVGLSTLFFEYEINIILLKATVDLTLGSLEMTSSFSGLLGWVNSPGIPSIPSGEISGEGDAHFHMVNLHVVGEATFRINIIDNSAQLETLEASVVVFDSLSVDLSQTFLVDGAPVDWASWSATFKENFDAEFAANKEQVLEDVRQAANSIIQNYTLQELIDLIGNIGCDPTEAPKLARVPAHRA